ncbi:hypothetical protein HDU96_009286 [Phlyctochytrium bullatum]|nr:hypothetical protein HDU96_009286 [Phlyctochytrium bullatum]
MRATSGGQPPLKGLPACGRDGGASGSQFHVGKMAWTVSAGFLAFAIVAAATPATFGGTIPSPPKPRSLADDPCAAIAALAKQSLARNGPNAAVATRREIMACFARFTINEADRRQQVEALISYLAIYPFLPLAKFAPPPLYPSTHDLVGTLRAIATVQPPVQSLFAFHTSIQRSIAALQDPHVVYTPACFSGVVYLQPWSLGVQYSWRGASLVSVRVVVRDTVGREGKWLAGRGDGVKDEVERFWRARGLYASEFVGWWVMSIDGVEVLSYLRAFAHQTGTARDPETSFTALLTRISYGTNATSTPEDGFFTVRPQHLVASDAVTYTLQHPQTGEMATVQVPWACVIDDAGMITSLGGGVEGYRTAFCERTAAAATGDAGARLRSGGGSKNGLGTAEAEETGIGPVVIWDERPRKKFWDRVAVDEEDLPPEDPGPILQEALAPVAPPPPSAPAPNVTVPTPLPDTNATIGRMTEKARTLSGVSTAQTVTSTATFAVNTKPSVWKAAETTGRPDPKPLAVHEGGAVFQISRFTGVWLFANIDPPDPDPGSAITKLQAHFNWLSDLVKALLALRARGVKNLIVDVSNNPGGVVCLGLSAAQALFPAQPLGPPIYDFTLHPSLVPLLNLTRSRTSPFYAFKLRNRATGARLTSTAELFDPGVLKRFPSGDVEAFTNPFHLNCSGYKDLTASWARAGVFPGDPPVTTGLFERLVVLSNGVCGSTCGTFARTLRAQRRTPLYTYGGSFPHVPHQPTSYEGGVVISFDDVRAALERENLTAHASPLFEKFPFYTEGRMPFYELLDASGEWPAEWVPMVADRAVVGVTDPLDRWSVWEATRRLEGWE